MIQVLDHGNPYNHSLVRYYNFFLSRVVLKYVVYFYLQTSINSFLIKVH